MRPSLLVGLVFCLGIAALIAGAQLARGDDWPQWRGPLRDGVSQEKGLLKSWPDGGPRLLWRASNLGEGHATPAVAGGRVYGMGLRGSDEIVWALNAADGQEIWSRRIAGRIQLGGSQGGYGPRSTPSIVGNRLYTLGVSGELACLELATGRVVWQHNLVREFGGDVPGWGYSESPLVDGDKVIVTPGGGRATVIALNRNSGETIWTSKIGDGAHYSSAIVAEVPGRRQYVQFLAGGVVGVDANDGRLLWRYDHPANGTANCATPIYHDGYVFAASNYGTGGGLVKIVPNGSGFAAQEIYFTKRMQNHHGGVVLVGDYLYGFDNSTLTCLDWKTGDVKWSDRSAGKGSLTCADGFLYARSEHGPIALVEATPRGYVEKGRFNQPERSGEPSWPYPVVADGRLYLRDQNVLLCYDVKG